jgi:predicted transcriptional regulator
VREVQRDSKLKFGWTAGIDNTEHMPLMSKLVAADLVDRVNGKYSLTALGEVEDNRCA